MGPELSESQIEELILTYLNYMPGIFAWKNPSAGYFNVKKGVFQKQRSKFAINGIPDILGFHQKKSLYIEVKTPKELKYLLKHYEMLRSYYGECKKKNHLKEQILFIERAKKHGQIAFFADSIKEVKNKLKEENEKGI